MARNPKLHAISTYYGLVTTQEENYDCPGYIETIQGIESCIIPLEDAEKNYMAVSVDDYTMVTEYISTLIRKCKRFER